MLPVLLEVFVMLPVSCASAEGSLSVSKDTVSVIVIAWNEVEIIESVVRGLYDAVVARMPDSELVVAEDGSTDGTKDVLARLSREIPFRHVSGDERKGYRRAMIDAMHLSEKDWVLFSDGDGQHDPSDFWRLWRYRSRADMLIGRKTPRRDAWHRVAMGLGYNIWLNLLFGVNFRDIDSGFRLIRRQLIEDVVDDVRTLPNCITSELTLRAIAKGYRVGEIPIHHLPRPFGDTKAFGVRRLPKVISEQILSTMALRSELKASR